VTAIEEGLDPVLVSKVDVLELAETDVIIEITVVEAAVVEAMVDATITKGVEMIAITEETLIDIAGTTEIDSVLARAVHRDAGDHLVTIVRTEEVGIRHQNTTVEDRQLVRSQLRALDHGLAVRFVDALVVMRPEVEALLPEAVLLPRRVR
jgi:hypothetical protein